MNYFKMINYFFLDVLMFYLPYTLATKNVLRFNINKVLPTVTRKMTIFFTPRPLFDGIMFLTACDDDFILKWKWIHISDGSMWNVYLSKTKVFMSHDTTCAVHYHVYVHRKNNLVEIRIPKKFSVCSSS